ncbi:MAG: DUF4248 domain-containing protein [Bacteroides sp.]|jgi:hypothetical protein|nr:DUF4248 domain-containing protein [Bacteroides sp.]
MKQNELEEEESFPIRIYPKADLAVLYCPDFAISTAMRNLAAWIRKNHALWLALQAIGYNRYRRCFMPREVELIVEYLGTPY